MKTYVGTKLDEPDFRAFAIRAAELGLSKSGLLRKIAIDAIQKAAAKKKKGVVK